MQLQHPNIIRLLGFWENIQNSKMIFVNDLASTNLKK
jgi:hypothetical protein